MRKKIYILSLFAATMLCSVSFTDAKATAWEGDAALAALAAELEPAAASVAPAASVEQDASATELVEPAAPAFAPTSASEAPALDAFARPDNIFSVRKENKIKKQKNRETMGFVYSVSFASLLDNLEDSQDFFNIPTRTIVGSSLLPTVGIRFGRHWFRTGFFAYTKYGSKKFVDKIEPILYYSYVDNRFKVYAGVFSRDYMKPTRLFHYTTSYKFLHNPIHGFLGQYYGKNGYLEAMIDWYLADFDASRDGFLLRLSGERYFGNLFINGSFSYQHRADTSLFRTFNVFDRLQYDFLVGYSLASVQPIFDDLFFTLGYVGDADQRRDDLRQGLQAGMGFEARVHMAWRGLYLDNIFYIGSPQMRYYNLYGSEIYTGNPFYMGKYLDQLSLGYVYKYKKLLEVGAHVVLYFTESNKVVNQEMLSLKFNFCGGVGKSEK